MSSRFEEVITPSFTTREVAEKTYKDLSGLGWTCEEVKAVISQDGSVMFTVVARKPRKM